MTLKTSCPGPTVTAVRFDRGGLANSASRAKSDGSVASSLAPLAMLPVVRLLQRAGTLPAWASAPVGLSVAAAGVGHYFGALRSLLLNGTALPAALAHAGVFPLVLGVASLIGGAVVAKPPRPPAGKGQVRRDPNGPWRANWWAMDEARRLLNDPSGLILGEACVPADQPDMIGRAPLLRWRPNGHLLTAAGSGAGKGISVVVPNCLGWAGPLVVHDPAGETLAIVRAHREGLGRTVRVVSINADTDGVNVLTWLDPMSKRFSIDVRTVVSWLDRGENGGTDEDSSFAGLSRTLCTALIMFVLTSETIPDSERHLLKVRELGASPNLRELLKTIVGVRDVARGAMANAASMVLTTMQSDETYAGVAMHFDKLTSCLEGTEEVLCGKVAPEKRFALADILRGDMDFFICLPSDVLESQPQIVRILLGALATLFLRNAERADHDTLFVVDEMPRLGRMQVLATARDVARKHALYVWAIVQDLAQLEEAFKKTGQRSWLASPAVLQFFGVNDFETAEMLSKRCGDYTAIQESESTSKGRTSNAGHGSSGSTSNTKSESSQPTRAALIPPDEILSLTVDENGTPEEQLLFVRGRRPLRCGLPKYFRRPEMAGLVAGNPYYRPTSAKGQGRNRRHQAMAAVYGAVLLGLAATAAVAPLPLLVGDEAVIVGDQPAPIFSLGGQPLQTAPLGWRVRVTSLPRQDGYVGVTFYDPQGNAWNALIRKEFLERS